MHLCACVYLVFDISSVSSFATVVLHRELKCQKALSKISGGKEEKKNTLHLENC